MRFLRQRNCDEVQGFYLALPMSAEDLVSYLKETAGITATWSHLPAPGSDTGGGICTMPHQVKVPVKGGKMLTC